VPSGVYPGNKGHKVTQVTRDRMAAAQKGHVPSEESRIKMGKTNQATWRRKIANGYVSPLKGKPRNKPNG